MCKLQEKLASRHIFTISGGRIAFLNFVPCQINSTHVMASTHALMLSANFCIILCIFMILNSSKSTAAWNNTLFTDSVVCYVLQLNSMPEVAYLSSRNKPITSQDLNGFQKGYSLCKLIERTSVALALIALSGDVEPNDSRIKGRSPE